MEHVNLELKQNLGEKLGQDVIDDYESDVKCQMRTRKIYSILSTFCSVLILLISFVSGIVGIIDISPVISKVAAGATLSIAGVERIKAFADNKTNIAIKKLSRLYQKTGIDTFGLYDNRSRRVSKASKGGEFD